MEGAPPVAFWLQSVTSRLKEWISCFSLVKNSFGESEVNPSTGHLLHIHIQECIGFAKQKYGTVGFLLVTCPDVQGNIYAKCARVIISSTFLA